MGSVVGLKALVCFSVAVAYYFKRVAYRTMMMNAGVCSAFALIAAVIALVRGAQAHEYQAYVFGAVVVVVVLPFLIRPIWGDTRGSFQFFCRGCIRIKVNTINVKTPV